MRVSNINGTSTNTCKCGSWLNHWKKYSGSQLPAYCPESTCVNKPEVGAHVQKEGSSDRGWYIVPLCSKHNAESGGSIEIGSIALASANVSTTCK